ERLVPVIHRELAEARSRQLRLSAEEEIRREQQRYRSIFESTAVALVELDLSEGYAELTKVPPDRRTQAVQDPEFLSSLIVGSRVLVVNTAASRLFGLDSPHAMLGRVDNLQ